MLTLSGIDIAGDIVEGFDLPSVLQRGFAEGDEGVMAIGGLVGHGAHLHGPVTSPLGGGLPGTDGPC
jgi:hypothetical protein